jgi:hypothetical protein
MIRRINFFGGPCTCKSTNAAFIFAELKKRGLSAELVDEYIKFWTYIPRVPKGFDSLYVQAKQIHKEDTILRAGTDFIVSDSPIMLQYYYAKHHNTPAQKQMLEIACEFEEMYPSINILLTRNDADYNELGRYETLEQAKEIDMELEEVLDNTCTWYECRDCHDNEGILDYVLGEIDNE